LILPASKAGRNWEVGAGETGKMELGAPFSFEFDFKQDDAKVTVDGPSIVVLGRGGESYQRLRNCASSPEVNPRKAGTGQGREGDRRRSVDGRARPRRRVVPAPVELRAVAGGQPAQGGLEQGPQGEAPRSGRQPGRPRRAEVRLAHGLVPDQRADRQADARRD